MLPEPFFSYLTVILKPLTHFAAFWTLTAKTIVLYHFCLGVFLFASFLKENCLYSHTIYTYNILYAL